MSCITNMFRSEKTVLESAFKGKTIVVSGAGRGIGREVAVLLAASGAKRLLLCSLRQGPLEVEEACKQAATHEEFSVVYRSVNVTDADAVKSWGKAFEDANPDDTDVHYVVANAGVAGGNGLLSTTEEVYDAVMATNVTGTITVLRTWVPLVVATARKSDASCGVLTVSSMLGLSAVFGAEVPHVQPYIVSKYAVRGLSESLQLELGAKQGCKNITVSGIYPGHVGTDIASHAKHATPDRVMKLPSPALKFFKYMGYDVPREILYSKLMEDVVGPMYRRYAPVSSEECARAMLLGSARGENRVLIGFDAQAVDFWTRHFVDYSYNPLFIKFLHLSAVVRPIYTHLVYRKPIVYYPFWATLAAAAALMLEYVSPKTYSSLSTAVLELASKAVALVQDRM